MYAKQKLAVYLKKSVRCNNMSVKMTRPNQFILNWLFLFYGNFNTPVAAACYMINFSKISLV